MVSWNLLAPDLKMCVTIYNEQKAGRDVWFTRLYYLLKDDASRLELLKNEDRLLDLGVIDGEWKKVEGKWTYCYRICKCTESFIKNVAENITEGSLDASC